MVIDFSRTLFYNLVVVFNFMYFFATLTYVDSPGAKSDTSKVEEEGEEKKDGGEEAPKTDDPATTAGEDSQSEKPDDSLVSSSQGVWLTLKIPLTPLSW